MTTRTFDWVANPSLVNTADYHIERRLPPIMMRVTAARLWSCPVVLNQSDEGECVGHGFAHCLAADPFPNPIVGTTILQNPEAEHIYERAQFFDGSPPDEQSGASVGGGAKAVQEQGYSTAFHWMSTIIDVENALLNLGPVVLGMNWHQDMMDVDTNGLIHPTGTLEGGHCICDIGFDPATGLHTLHQSWGSSWGRNGDCLIHSADLALLLSQQGEACIPTKVSVPVPTPTPPSPPSPPADADTPFAQILVPWVKEHHVRENHHVAVAANLWLKAKGYIN